MHPVSVSVWLIATEFVLQLSTVNYKIIDDTSGKWHSRQQQIIVDGMMAAECMVQHNRQQDITSRSTTNTALKCPSCLSAHDACTSLANIQHLYI
jgi:hypothetical protein